MSPKKKLIKKVVQEDSTTIEEKSNDNSLTNRVITKKTKTTTTTVTSTHELDGALQGDNASANLLDTLLPNKTVISNKLSNTNSPEIAEKSANQSFKEEIKQTNDNDSSLNEFKFKKDKKIGTSLDSSPIIELFSQKKTDEKYANKLIDLEDEDDDDDDCEIISWNVLSSPISKNKSPIVKNEPNSPYKSRFNRSLKKTSQYE